MIATLKDHWPEYVIEAWCLGTFMVSACAFGVLLFHDGSPLSRFSFGMRNTAMGIAMGVTAIAIICSPWGKRSGAHFNPAVTLTYLRLGKIARIDAGFYILSHFIGALVGVFISWLILGSWIADIMVNFVATVPGEQGLAMAFWAEISISFLMMATILFISNTAKWARFTPVFAGTLLAIFIIFESQISGTSLNPARTFASAVFSGKWEGWWIYFVAPPIAMLAAAEVFVRTRGVQTVICAKLHHDNPLRCIFSCGYHDHVTEIQLQPSRKTGSVLSASSAPERRIL